MTDAVHTIDAKGKRIGRIASEASSHLSGKTSTSYMPNKVAPVRVDIINASSMDISEKKRVQKKYARYSGYPGGLSFKTLEQEIAKHGMPSILRKAIRGMLPSNKLRPLRLKNLNITD